LIKLRLGILAIPLAFALISAPVSFVYYLTTRHLTGEQAVLHSHLRNIVAFELNPFLLLVVSYYATKRMELRYSLNVDVASRSALLMQEGGWLSQMKLT